MNRFFFYIIIFCNIINLFQPFDWVNVDNLLAWTFAYFIWREYQKEYETLNSIKKIMDENKQTASQKVDKALKDFDDSYYR